MINNEALKKNIGQAIRFYRRKKGISQYKLAELTELSPSYISEIETGKKTPSLETLLEIAKALDVDLWDLLIPIDLPPNVKIAVKSLLRQPDIPTSEANLSRV